MRRMYETPLPLGLAETYWLALLDGSVNSGEFTQAGFAGIEVDEAIVSAEASCIL